MIKDLISLDESRNTSFDLEDFDPLNMNAKPIPMTLINTTVTGTGFPVLPNHKGMSLNRCTIPSVHNPIYPYFTPQHHKVVPSSSGTDINRHDAELLKKYGLDQFSLTPGTTTENVVAQKLSNINLNDGKNWTTFE